MIHAYPENQREPGTITSARFGSCSDSPTHDTVWCQIDLHNGGTQGFGGYYLNDKDLLKAFERELTRAFGCRALKELAGKRCYALRHFGHLNDTIVGLESVDTGKRFTIYQFRRDMNLPGADKDPLEERVERCRKEVEWAKGRLEEAQLDLKNVRNLFKEW